MRNIFIFFFYLFIFFFILVYGYDQRAEVHTSRGMYSAENLGHTSVQVADSRGFTTDNPPDCMYIFFFLILSLVIYYFFLVLTRYKDAYESETRHFIALLQGEETEPRSPMRDYVVTAKIAEAAKTSLASGKPVAFEP